MGSERRVGEDRTRLVVVLCLRDEHVAHWFEGDRRLAAGPVVRHRPLRRASELLADVRHSILAALDARNGEAGPDEIVLALDGDLDPASGLVLATSAWVDRDVRPAAHLLDGLPGTRLAVVDGERLLAESAVRAAEPSPDVVTGVFQLGYRMSLHLAVGTTLTATDGAQVVNERLNHSPLPGNDRVCFCGRVGCLASVVGSNSLVDRYLEAGGGLPLQVGRAVVEAAGRGDPVAHEAVEQTRGWLAAALAPWIDLLGVRRMIVTGPGAAEPVGRSFLQRLAGALPLHQRALGWEVVPLQRAADHLRPPATSSSVADPHA